MNLRLVQFDFFKVPTGVYLSDFTLMKNKTTCDSTSPISVVAHLHLQAKKIRHYRRINADSSRMDTVIEISVATWDAKYATYNAQLASKID